MIGAKWHLTTPPPDLPGIGTTFYNAKCVEVIDPFANRIRFMVRLVNVYLPPALERSRPFHVALLP
jgi:hypothetical protein